MILPNTCIPPVLFVPFLYKTEINYLARVTKIPFLYKTEINYLARVTKIMGIVNKNTRDYATSRYLTCVSK